MVETARADPKSPAARSVRAYCGMLGAFAGDLALVFRADGGVWLTGGVIDHLGDAFDGKAFLARFVAKGRYTSWLKHIAVSRIVADDLPLRGCDRFLARVG